MFDYKKTIKEYEDLKNSNPNIYKNKRRFNRKFRF